MAMFTLLVGCQKPTQYQSLKNTFDEMSYAEYRYFKIEDFSDFLDKVKTEKFLKIGGEEFAVNLHDTTTYAYRITGKHYDIYIDLHQTFPGKFSMMKRWESWQEKYHKKSPYWMYNIWYWLERNWSILILFLSLLLNVLFLFKFNALKRKVNSLEFHANRNNPFNV